MAHGALSILQSPIRLEDMNELGNLVRDARNQRHMKAYQLADAIGKQASFVSRLENGVMKELPSPEDLEKLSKVLGIPVPTMVEAAGYQIRSDAAPAWDSALPPDIRDLLGGLDWDSPLVRVRAKMMLETLRDTQQPKPASDLERLMATEPGEGMRIVPVKEDDGE